ncbi:unnamed protein product [Sympodiomycopsis kandeliae]
MSYILGSQIPISVQLTKLEFCDGINNQQALASPLFLLCFDSPPRQLSGSQLVKANLFNIIPFSSLPPTSSFHHPAFSAFPARSSASSLDFSF